MNVIRWSSFCLSRPIEILHIYWVSQKSVPCVNENNSGNISTVPQLDKCLKFMALPKVILYRVQSFLSPRTDLNFRHLFSCDTTVQKFIYFSKAESCTNILNLFKTQQGECYKNGGVYKRVCFSTFSHVFLQNFRFSQYFLLLNKYKNLSLRLK